MRRGQEGSEKEKEEKPCHIGTRSVNLFTAYMRYLGTQEPMEKCGRELRGGGELICMFQQLWTRAESLFMNIKMTAIVSTF